MIMKTKILFMIHDLMHGGAEKVLVNLVNNMDREKYDITVLTLFDVGVNKQFLGEHIHYKTVFRKMFRGNSYIQKLFSPEMLYKFCVKEKYDILVAYLEGTCTRIIGGCQDPEVIKIGWRHIVESPKEFLSCYRSMDEAKRIYQRLDKVVGVSETVIEAFEEVSGLKGISTVKYNTNETEKIKILSQEPVDNPDFCPEDMLSVIGVAKVRPRKGFMRLAHVHKKLWDEGYRHRIYVLGEGEERTAIEKYLRQNHLEDSFIFLGYDTNPYKYVSKCDLFVCPSFEEGFSTAATEALVVGTPVLTTLCSGMKEMLGENEYGYIVENSEEGIYHGLKYLLDNRDKLDYYTEQAEERGKYFSMERTVQAVQEMFDELLEKKCK